MSFDSRDENEFHSRDGLQDKDWWLLEKPDPTEHLTTAIEEARSHLRELLERPSLLTPEQWEEMRILAGPKQSRLETDIDLYRNWCERAITLLRAIHQTLPSALSDSEWSALLVRTLRAIEETNHAVRRLGFVYSVDIALQSMEDIEPWNAGRIKGPGDPGNIGGPENPGRSIGGPENPGRSIGGPEDPGRSIGGSI